MLINILHKHYIKRQIDRWTYLLRINGKLLINKRSDHKTNILESKLWVYQRNIFQKYLFQVNNIQSLRSMHLERLANIKKLKFLLY